MKNLILLLLICLSMPAISQSVEVYPTHWWTGMKNQSLQLMIHSDDDVSKAVSINYPGVRIKRVTQPSNKHYVFIDIDIAMSAKPGNFKIRAGNNSIPYELKKRNPGNGKITAICAACQQTSRWFS